MCKKTVDLKHFRTLTGPARKAAIRAYLVKVAELDFTADPHTLRSYQQCALSDVAKAVSWKKSVSAPLSLGLSFFVYLQRGAV